MRPQTTGLSRALSLASLALMLCSPLELRSQEEMAEFVPGSIQTSIESEAQTWANGKSAFVLVKVKNNSNISVKVVGIYALGLRRADDRTHYGYSSLVDITSRASLKQPTISRKLAESAAVWQAMERTIHLVPGEVKAMRLDLSRLYWYEFVPADWSSREMETVPTGIYYLTFVISLRDRRDAKGTLISTGISSERVRIAVE